jgi:hypothetical protein
VATKAPGEKSTEGWTHATPYPLCIEFTTVPKYTPPQKRSLQAHYAASPVTVIPEKQMSAARQNPASAELPYQPIPFSKKHRISIEDAKAILEKHGADRKSADKEARRVSV